MDEIRVIMTLRFVGTEDELEYLREAIDQIPGGSAHILGTVDEV